MPTGRQTTPFERGRRDRGTARMVHKHVRKCSMSSVIRQMQTKATMKYPLPTHPPKWLKLNRLKTSFFSEKVEQAELLHMAGGNTKDTISSGKSSAISYKEYMSHLIVFQFYHRLIFYQKTKLGKNICDALECGFRK